MGILPSSYLCCGHSPHHRGTISQSIQLSPVEKSSRHLLIHLLMIDVSLIKKKTISRSQINSQVVAVFLAYSRTSVVMASGRELCYVLLLGDFAKKKSLFGAEEVLLNQSSPFRNPALLLCSLHPPGKAFSG